MAESRYAILAMSLAEARCHPAYKGASWIATPQTGQLEGARMTGYVLTDGFYGSLCSGDADARRIMDTARRNVTVGQRH